MKRYVWRHTNLSNEVLLDMIKALAMIETDRNCYLNVLQELFCLISNGLRLLVVVWVLAGIVWRAEKTFCCHTWRKHYHPLLKTLVFGKDMQ